MKILERNEVGTGILIEQDAGYISLDILNNKALIKEAVENGSNEFFMYCILQKADVENRNGRVYSLKILKREDIKYQDVIKRNSALGEEEHPDTSIISLNNVAHRILETWWEGNTLMGKLQILVSLGYIKSGIISNKADNVANLLRYGVTLGISSRGVGSLKKEGNKNVVQDDFELICFDIVSSPSTPGAYLFKNLEDKEKYDEVLVPMESQETKEESAIAGKSKNLMNKLDRFLGKY